jgi:hypothetical protein
VWANRLEGAALGLWSVPAGERGSLPWVGNELEGARSGVRWARLHLERGVLVVAMRVDEDPAAAGATDHARPTHLAAPFLWLSRPAFPEGSRGAVAALPRGLDAVDGFAVLHRAPPIGTKFHDAPALSPLPAAAAATSRAGEVSLLWLPGTAAEHGPTPRR